MSFLHWESIATRFEAITVVTFNSCERIHQIEKVARDWYIFVDIVAMAINVYRWMSGNVGIDGVCAIFTIKYTQLGYVIGGKGGIGFLEKEREKVFWEEREKRFG